MFQPLDPAIIKAFDYNLARAATEAHFDFMMNIKKRYVRTGGGCGLCSDGSLWFDLQFEVK